MEEHQSEEGKGLVPKTFSLGESSAPKSTTWESFLTATKDQNEVSGCDCKIIIPTSNKNDVQNITEFPMKDTTGEASESGKNVTKQTNRILARFFTTL